MNQDPLNYQTLLQDALRGLVRRSLEIVAEQGFTGDHHFYLSFRTIAPGVFIPPHMLDSYPEEMTIVLKTQFKDLTVSEQEFSVGLFFGGVLYYLTIPFAAVTGFADPSADFHLGFQTDTAQTDTAQTDTAQTDTAQTDGAQTDTAQTDGADAEEAVDEEAEADGVEDSAGTGSANVGAADNVVAFSARKRGK